MKSKILVINGPNLNLLGTREPEIYGDMTLDDIARYTEGKLANFDVQIEWFQSNIEGEIVSKIQEAGQAGLKALVINPAAYSHTSVAILDALKMLSIPVIEVHLSNTNLREEFRKNKLTAQASTSLLEGFGKDGYYLAIYSQLMD